MLVINDLENYKTEKRSVLTLGKFDGIHRGHQKLFRIMNEHKAYDEQIVAFTFDFSIRTVLTGKTAKYILDDVEKREVLKKIGVDVLVECPFTDAVRTMEPEMFVKHFLVDVLHVSKIVIGDDFRFGYNRAGDAVLLATLASKYGYEFYRIEKETEDGAEISSTRVRAELEQGNIEAVNRLLGFPYFCSSKVIHGNHIGAGIGSPTINQPLSDVKLVPPFGVYFSKCIIDGKEYPSVSNIGVKPTVGDNNQVGLETFLLDFSGDLYGKNIKTELFHYRRPEKKFASLSELEETITADSGAARAYWGLKS